jgi:3-oxoacyl-[acyl-carrier-protein] synthase III
MTARLEDACIVSGIGQSEIGRRVEKGVMALTLDAVLEAIADAGLRPADIDGVMSWPGAVSRADGLAPSAAHSAAGPPGTSGRT